MIDKTNDGFELENKKRIDFESTDEFRRKRDKNIMLQMLRRHQYWLIIKKIIDRKRISRLSHAEKENNFHTKAKQGGHFKKIAVYTCITGGYDKLEKPCFHSDDVDYYAFIDDTSKYDINGWNIKAIPAYIRGLVNNDNILINRYVKFHPNEILAAKYDYAVYIDGNIKVVGDVSPLVEAVHPKTGLALHRHRQRDSLYDEIKVCLIMKKGNREKLKGQAKRYKKEGFPDKFGLYECNVIVSDLKNEKSTEILNDWWCEFMRSQSNRDQIALPYVIWKKGFSYNDIGSLGDNVYRNQKFQLDSNIHKGANE